MRFPLDLYFSVTGWILVTVPIGARLLHVFYEEPAYYAESPFRILEVWKGGFVYVGGLIFSLLFFILYFQRQRGRSFWQTVDFFTPILALGTGLGRWACFFQGCCFGRDLDAFWAHQGKHPTQLYIFAWEMILFFSLMRMERSKLRDGSLFLFWLGLSALGRFIIEFYRADFRGAMVSGLSISQVISVGLVALSLGLGVARGRNASKKSVSS